MDVKIGISFLHEIFFTNEQYAYRTIYLYFIKHVNEFFILTRKQHKIIKISSLNFHKTLLFLVQLLLQQFGLLVTFSLLSSRTRRNKVFSIQQ